MAASAYQVTALAKMTAAYRNQPVAKQRAAFDTVVDAARKQRPDQELAFITFPGSDFSGEHHFGVFTRARAGVSRKLLHLVLVDAKTGEVTANAELPWFLKAVLLSQPLHYGDYGGLPLKILWALFGVGSTVLSATGLYVFVSRRRGRKAGRVEIASPLAALDVRPQPAGAMREVPNAPV